MRIFTSARSLREYELMFDLRPSDLRRKVLDCGAGAASFTAEWTRLGGTGSACDPIYASPETVTRLGSEGVYVASRNISEDPDMYDFSGFPATFEEHERERRSASRLFLEDFEAQEHTDRYLGAGAQNLHSLGHTWDLVLMSHVLFVYSDQITPDQHIEMLSGMLSVASEARVFPLKGYKCDSAPALDAVREWATDSGLQCTVRSVPYSFWRGTGEMLVVERLRP